MTNEEVKAKAEELTAFWQKQLRLQDWDVEIIVPKHDPDCVAQIERTNTFNTARITVRNPDMHHPNCAAKADLEYTIVHELLHLRFPYVTFTGNMKDSAENDSFEFGVELVAQALVHMRRQEVRE